MAGGVHGGPWELPLQLAEELVEHLHEAALDEDGLRLLARLVGEERADDKQKVGLQRGPELLFKSLEAHDAQVLVEAHRTAHVHGAAVQAWRQLLLGQYHHHLPVLPGEAVARRGVSGASATTTTTTTTTTVAVAVAVVAAAVPQQVEPRRSEAEPIREAQSAVGREGERAPQAGPGVVGDVAVPNGPVRRVEVVCRPETSWRRGRPQQRHDARQQARDVHQEAAVRAGRAEVRRHALRRG